MSNATQSIIAGMKIGMLTVIREIPNPGGEKLVMCRCDCGKELPHGYFTFARGKTFSCGCTPFGLEENNKAHFTYRLRSTKPTCLGRQFGLLTCIASTNYRYLGQWIYKFECACGEFRYYTLPYVSSCNKSCGCVPKLKSHRVGQMLMFRGRLTPIKDISDITKLSVAVIYARMNAGFCRKCLFKKGRAFCKHKIRGRNMTTPLIPVEE